MCHVFDFMVLDKYNTILSGVLKDKLKEKEKSNRKI